MNHSKGRTQNTAPSTQYRGVDSTRRGKAPPLAILSPISHRGEMGHKRSVPGRALVFAGEIGEGNTFCLSSKTAKKYGQHLLTVLFYDLEFSDGSACAPPRQCSAAAPQRPERPRTPAAETGRQSEARSQASGWPGAWRCSQASGMPRACRWSRERHRR